MNIKLIILIIINIGLIRKIKILIFISGMYCLCLRNGCNIICVFVYVMIVVVYISLLKYIVI